jgi:hypothetical protein
VRIHTFMSGAIALALVPLLSACSPESDLRDVASPAASTSEMAEPAGAGDGGPCDVLDAEAVADLAGGPITAHSDAVVGALPACQWQDGDLRVQVIQVPAGEWAVSMPALLDQMRESGGLDETNLARIDEAIELIESGVVAPAAACAMFSTMAEIAGHETGTDRLVNLVPNAEEPQALSGQACFDGVYTSVLLVSPGLSKESKKVSEMTVVLNKLMAAGV